MNDTKSIINKLRKSGIQIFLNGESLEIASPLNHIEASLLSEIRYHKEDIIQYLKRKTGSKRISPIHAIPVSSRYVLSSSQRRLWMLSQFQGGNAAYHIPGVFIFEGDLNRLALMHAFKALIVRHESLRTIFKEESGDVYQVIQSPDEHLFELVYTDLQMYEDNEERVKNLITDELSAPFDLTTGPLLRAGLYQLTVKRWVFSFVMHHIISDGWSINVLIKELSFFYNNYKHGLVNSISPLRIQYKDYAAWQQNQLSDESLNRHREYWLKQFEGELPVLELHGDYRRPAVKTYHGGSVTTTLNPVLSQKLKALCREHDSTLFMGLLAGVNVLLYRYTGQSDIIVGSPVAGREHADLENQIGFYVNTLALRSRFSGAEHYMDLLDQVKNTTVSAYEHQAYPFDELVEALSLERDTSRNPLFEVMVTIRDNDATMNTRGGYMEDIRIGKCEVDSLGSKFDLTFTFIETEDSIALDLGYNIDIYSEEMMTQMSSHYTQLIESIVDNPRKPLQDLDYLTVLEKHELLNEFNDIDPNYTAGDKTIIDWFEDQVEKTPDSIAIVFEATSLSYKELNESANRLGNYLRENYQIEANDLVGIRLERNEWMIISIFAVMKSGGAYVPVDPDYPQERIVYMLEDSRCKVLIDAGELRKFQRHADEYSHSDLKMSIAPDNLAYVIYTSGSNGKPKGVMIEHKNIGSFAVGCIDKYSGKSKIVMPLLASTAFDISLFEFLLPLLSGGTAIMLANDKIKDIRYLTRQLRQVTALHAVPALMAQILIEIKANCTSGGYDKILDLYIGGDYVPTNTLEEMRLIFPKARINVLYGPTESTIFISSNQYLSEDKKEFKGALIGKPNKNSAIYIMDSSLHLTPKWVFGEICAAGGVVARGYLNKPDLTGEKFIAGKDTEKRIYRTGDIGRWLSDGTIEFLGRLDNQVKIRGYRIELGEIENVARNYPEVETVVVVPLDNGEEKELVMYIVFQTVLNISKFRAHLSEVLPAYMIPGRIIQLDFIPLTPNGKLDKKSLRLKEGIKTDSNVEYEAPRNETEIKLVMVWEEILGRERIGINDNFFEVGGTSIKIIKLSKMAGEVLNKEIPIALLFQYSTIKELVSYFQNEQEILLEDDFDKDELINDLNKINWDGGDE